MADNLIKFSASLDRYQLPADQAQSELNCHVQIVPDVIKREENEKETTASICLVFDCSLSMTGRNFEAAVETAKMIVDKLHERHWLSLVAFQSKSHIVFKNAVPTEGEKDLIKEQIDKLESHLGGSTNMSAGIETGMDVLLESIADANIMVLLSDGVPDFPGQAQIAADTASQKGIQIFAMPINYYILLRLPMELSLVTAKWIN